MAQFLGFRVVVDVPVEKTTRSKTDLTTKLRTKFVAGINKQIDEQKGYEPGKTFKRSWVTRDDAKGEAWVTLKYGNNFIPLDKDGASSFGPIPAKEVVSTLNRVKEAVQEGKLDEQLKAVFESVSAARAGKVGKKKAK